MSSPLPTVTVTGHYVTLANVPAEGHLSLTPVVHVAGLGYIIVGKTVVALIRNGTATATVIADSVNLSGRLFVRVVEHVEGIPDSAYVIRPTGPGTVDLSLAPRMSDPPPKELYIPATALGQPNGVATLGPDGILAANQRPDAPGTVPGQVFVYPQPAPLSVFNVSHNMGRRPAIVTLFSLDYGDQFDEYSWQHLDADTLRISMDLPTPCVALIA